MITRHMPVGLVLVPWGVGRPESGRLLRAARRAPRLLKVLVIEEADTLGAHQRARERRARPVSRKLREAALPARHLQVGEVL